MVLFEKILFLHSQSFFFLDRLLIHNAEEGEVNGKLQGDQDDLPDSRNPSASQEPR